MDIDHSKCARAAASSTISNRFVITKSDFERQYAQTYFLRLNKMRQAVQVRAAALWPASDELVHAASIKDIPNDRECVVAGTLFKEMKLKPNILDEYDKVKALAAKKRTVFMSPDDSLILEDDSGRIRLTNPPDQTVLDIQRLATGPVVALRGMVEESGAFQVRAICFMELGPQKPISAKGGAARYLCLVSGLHIGDPKVDPLPMQMWADFVSGFLGSSEMAASIAQVIIAGDSLTQIDSNDASVAEKAQHKKSGLPDKSVRPLAEFDMLLTQVAASCPVLLMPGALDPANVTMPQQPLHQCLFRSASTFSSFQSSTNPCELHLDDVHIVGSSGQPIEDLAKFSIADSHFQHLENTLHWAHIAPTAPDTLSCYPLNQDEPFVLTNAPHIYFAGNQPSFETKLIEGSDGQRVRLVSVPTFADTQIAVLINLETLECEPIKFEVPSSM